LTYWVEIVCCTISQISGFICSLSPVASPIWAVYIKVLFPILFLILFCFFLICLSPHILLPQNSLLECNTLTCRGVQRSRTELPWTEDRFQGRSWTEDRTDPSPVWIWTGPVLYLHPYLEKFSQKITKYLYQSTNMYQENTIFSIFQQQPTLNNK